MNDYSAFQYGAERGRSAICPTCGVTPGNEHSLREGGWCDRLRGLGLTYTSDAGRTLLAEMGWKQKRKGA